MSGVLVTGGTGKTGKTLVRELREAGVRARAASRNPAAADPDAIRFDWSDPTTFGPALDGMDRVFLLPPVESVDPLPLVEPFLRQARRAGVRRLVMLGSAIVLPNAPSAVEMAARVRARPGGVVLRASGFMQNFLRPHPLAEHIHRHGVIRTAAGDGEVGWVDARDIAASAAALLADPGADARSDYLVTGPHGMSYPQAARIITARTGRRVRVERMTEQEQAAAYRASGMPAEFAAALAAVERGIKEGREDQVSTAVLELTGRPPRAFADFVSEHADEWTR
ncbi:NAD(P)H-binding protein [Streptomyces sp. SID8382]|uniref:NAD(P)H-binding protein n=1 Tax=Streptomyces TaxID=1883 RepID=UPI000C2C763C|nr:MULTISPECIES: NAD(P)H-binding protein [unclassified Streptomyces]AUA15180.1 NAD(P)H azoreductase [Streptomyces sp. M56]MCD9590561.1 NAD(P)H-binding protein [Streptomyces sp. 8ZJF_21]MYX63171.1 NAD(P)H-binding protein [Streptomyces sp. SID8382]